MKIVATIEARMTSSRLPGKPMLKSCGKTMIEHLVKRLKSVPSIDIIVLATTVNDADDSLVAIAKDLEIQCFRGDEDDVMNRVIAAASSVDADVIVEITGDCPIIDPSIIEQTIQLYMENNADYVGNTMVRSYPDGMDVQVFSLETLIKSSGMTNDPLDLEHVTLHIRNNPQIFSHMHLVAPPEIKWPELAVTLDEQRDYVLIDLLIKKLSKNNKIFSCYEIVKYLQKEPSLLDINSSVPRKGDA